MKAYILGSGIGGMSCAALLANNGFDVTEIYLVFRLEEEMHHKHH